MLVHLVWLRDLRISEEKILFGVYEDINHAIEISEQVSGSYIQSVHTIKPSPENKGA